MDGISRDSVVAIKPQMELAIAVQFNVDASEVSIQAVRWIFEAQTSDMTPVPTPGRRLGSSREERRGLQTAAERIVEVDYEVSFDDALDQVEKVKEYVKKVAADPVAAGHLVKAIAEAVKSDPPMDFAQEELAALEQVTLTVTALPVAEVVVFLDGGLVVQDSQGPAETQSETQSESALTGVIGASAGGVVVLLGGLAAGFAIGNKKRKGNLPERPNATIESGQEDRGMPFPRGGPAREGWPDTRAEAMSSLRNTLSGVISTSSQAKRYTGATPQGDFDDVHLDTDEPTIDLEPGPGRRHREFDL